MCFKVLIYCVLVACIDGGSGLPYISTVSRGYTTTETGDPFFECYRGSPDLDTTVNGRRYVPTYNGPANLANRDPPSGTYFTAGIPPRRAYRVDLITADHRSYGVFYCSACLGRECSVVPTIFLRSDANFVSANGRLTKTVNKGDVDVVIAFRETSDKPTPGGKMWKLNGSAVSTSTFSPGTNLQTSTACTISEVNPSHAGIYEIVLAGKRDLATAGLLRLIVRECPRGHYNVSTGCNEICPPCYNGGICHDKTGRCICPPGFMGDNCEIGCGGNRYGLDCEYRCDYELDNKTACSGFQVCVPDPYGCSCTPGFKGLKCTTECDRGEFGASCTEICQCASGKCDRFTGECTDISTATMASEPGCTGSNCNDCPADRFNVSSGCTMICPSCYNGGICHDKTGRCICPPGFMGDNCEIECDQGEFGAGCTEICQCASGKCDRFTGDCSDNSTVSEPGCTGNSCQGDEGRTPLYIVILPFIGLFSVILFVIIIYNRRKSCQRKPYDDTACPETAPPAYQDLCHEYEGVSNVRTAYQDLNHDYEGLSNAYQDIFHDYERVGSEGTKNYYLTPRSVTELYEGVSSEGNENYYLTPCSVTEIQQY